MIVNRFPNSVLNSMLQSNLKQLKLCLPSETQLLTVITATQTWFYELLLILHDIFSYASVISLFLSTFSIQVKRYACAKQETYSFCFATNVKCDDGFCVSTYLACET